MKALVVTSRNHSISNRGIDVIIDYLRDEQHDVTIYVYPISFSNKKVLDKRMDNHLYGKYSLFNYYESLMRKLPYKITELLFRLVYKFSNSIKLDQYDLIVIESGYGVSLTREIPDNCKVLYRQSDSLELIITKNKYLVECEKELINRSIKTLVPNSKIMNYYINMGYQNVVLWENGFQRLSLDSNSLNPFEPGTYNGVYMGLYPVDDKLLEFLANQHKETHFHIIGPHKDKTNLKNIHYHGYLESKDYLRYLKFANFTIIPIKNTLKLNYVGQTSKIYQFLDCKKPVITTNYGFISEFAKLTNNIYVCDNFVDFDKTISELKTINFAFYEDLDLSKYEIENRKKELDLLLKRAAQDND